jgi:hypothetical protein
MFPCVLSEHCMRCVTRGPPYIPASLAEIWQILKEINLVLFSNDNLISWQCEAWKKSSANKHELIIPYCKCQRRREIKHALPHDTR